jgi:hypothetical protein
MPHPTPSPGPSPAHPSGQQYSYVSHNPHRPPSASDINNALQDIQDRLYAIQQRQTTLEGLPVAMKSDVPTAQQTSQALAQAGSSPLNVSGLSGTLSSVQAAAIPVVTALPPVITAQQDQVVFFSGHIYHFQAGNPGAWTLIL